MHPGATNTSLCIDRAQGTGLEHSEDVSELGKDVPPRPVPTQFLAYQQLQYRYEDKSAPFLVRCVAPAGFGKSTLISAWLQWLYVNHKEKWQTLAPTGIASTQVSGATIHAALLLAADGKTLCTTTMSN